MAVALDIQEGRHAGNHQSFVDVASMEGGTWRVSPQARTDELGIFAVVDRLIDMNDLVTLLDARVNGESRPSRRRDDAATKGPMGGCHDAT